MAAQISVAVTLPCPSCSKHVCPHTALVRLHSTCTRGGECAPGPDLGAHFREPYDGLGDEAGSRDGEAELADRLRDAGELDLYCAQSAQFR